jgi:DNA mismatch repair ATPase MutS
MAYLILVAIFVVAFIIYVNYNARTARGKKIRRLRDAWGKPKAEFFNFYLIEKYSKFIDERAFHRLSEQTLWDIDFYDLFRFIDRTTSKIGQQLLFKKLTEPADDPQVLLALNESAEFFSTDTVVREQVQLELLRLADNNAFYISSLLQDKLLKKPKWFALIIANMAMTAVFLALAFKYPIFVIVLIVPVSINMLIHYWNKENIFQFTRSFPQLNIMIDVCRKVSAIHHRFLDKSVGLSLARLESFQRKSRLLSFSNHGGIRGEFGQLEQYFVELIKSVFLIEVFTLFSLVREVEARRDSIRHLFTFVGDIDVALSIASLRAGDLKTCRPVIHSAEKKLSARKVYHPLVKHCVKNDIDILSRSVLITGSNMSGKTTFLRTILLNTVLAQSIYTCFADAFEAPVLKQFSSIRIDDNVIEGKSYYFEEVSVMAELIKEVDSGAQNLFILDEVLRGTNNVERIASAKAILSYLNRNNNIVLVSTHDIELSHLLEKEYVLYHFSEEVEKGEFVFDHKLKAGRLKTRNAIRIMEKLKYPEAITEEAHSLSDRLDRGSFDSK